MGELSRQEDAWQRRALDAAVAAGREMVADGALLPATPIGRLSDRDWGRLAQTVISGWIMTRAEQAVSEGRDTERAILVSGFVPDPWDGGALSTILPELAETQIDWSRPLAEWSREAMAAFVANVHRLARKALIARNVGAGTFRRMRPPPRLADLIAEYGGYDRIPPEAWIAFDAELEQWQADVQLGIGDEPAQDVPFA
jgi:hypothetical protein